MSWDRVGLVTGDPDQPVRRVHFAVDPTLAVIDEARRLGADLLVTHHPLLLRGVHSVATTSAKGAAVTALVVGDVRPATPRTPTPTWPLPGVSDALAAACGLSGTQAADRPGRRRRRPGGRPGRAGDAAGFAERLAAALPPAPVGVRVAGPRTPSYAGWLCSAGPVTTCSTPARASGCDVYVTADLRHHPALEAREEARGGPPYLIDAGHWATEWLWLQGARRRLGARWGSGALGWRPTSPRCAPTPGTSWSGRVRPSCPEVRPESRPEPPVAAAGPAGHRHPAGPDRPPPRDAAEQRRARRGGRPPAAPWTTTWSAPGPPTATCSARSPRPTPTCSWCATAPPATRPA